MSRTEITILNKSETVLVLRLGLFLKKIISSIISNPLNEKYQGKSWEICVVKPYRWYWKCWTGVCQEEKTHEIEGKEDTVCPISVSCYSSLPQSGHTKNTPLGPPENQKKCTQKTEPSLQITNQLLMTIHSVYIHI